MFLEYRLKQVLLTGHTPDLEELKQIGVVQHINNRAVIMALCDDHARSRAI